MLTLTKLQAFHSLARGVDCSVSALVFLKSRESIFAACNGLPEILEIGLMDGLTRSSLRSGKRLGLWRMEEILRADRQSNADMTFT